MNTTELETLIRSILTEQLQSHDDQPALACGCTSDGVACAVSRQS